MSDNDLGFPFDLEGARLLFSATEGVGARTARAACDEIDRLRTELAAAQTQIDGLTDMLDNHEGHFQEMAKRAEKAEAERAKLVEALKRYATGGDDDGGGKARAVLREVGG